MNLSAGGFVGTVTFTGAQTNSVGSGISVLDGQVNLQTNGGSFLTMSVSASTTLTIGGGSYVNPSETLGTLAIASGGMTSLVSAAPAATPALLLHVGTLSINGDASPTGTLDMAADDAIVDNGVFSTIQAQVKSGFNGGAWNGVGIQSTRAALHSAVAGIGYATAAQIGTTTFDGVSGLSSTAVLLKYTLLGDGNLDGTVNALDFNALASNYGTTSNGAWAQGDYNYDGSVDSNDFALLADNYGMTLATSTTDAALPDGAMPAAGLGALVPEPTSIGMLLACGAGLIKRRRRA